MKKYWFYIESYCFIHTNSEWIIIINTLSSAKTILKKTAKINEIINRLLARESFYCIELTDQDMANEEVKTLANRVRKSFSGDYIDQKQVKTKPLFPYPILKLQRQISNLENTRTISPGIDILTYLKELTIYVNSSCSQNCSQCLNAFKQIIFCTREGSGELELSEIKRFLNKIQGSGLSVINIIGGDIFEYSYFNSLVEFLKETPYRISFHNHLGNVLLNLNRLKFLTGSNDILNIDVSFPIDKIWVDKILSEPLLKKINIRWSFLVSSEDEYSEVSNIVDSLNIRNAMIYPYYNRKNKDFFEDYVFLEENDLLVAEVDKQDYFSKQVLNNNHFGKLTVLPQGTLFSNVNNDMLGNINSSIPELLFKELKSDNSWLNIRNIAPCNDCMYQWICPSPSNYEHAIGKPNLCHIKP